MYAFNVYRRASRIRIAVPEGKVAPALESRSETYAGETTGCRWRSAYPQRAAQSCDGQRDYHPRTSSPFVDRWAVPPGRWWRVQTTKHCRTQCSTIATSRLVPGACRMV